MVFGNSNDPIEPSAAGIGGAKNAEGKMSHHDEKHMTKLIKNKLKRGEGLSDVEYEFASEHDLLLSKEEKHMMNEVKKKLKRGESLYEDEKDFAAQHKLL